MSRPGEEGKKSEETLACVQDKQIYTLVLNTIKKCGKKPPAPLAVSKRGPTARLLAAPRLSRHLCVALALQRKNAFDILQNQLLRRNVCDRFALQVPDVRLRFQDL